MNRARGTLSFLGCAAVLLTLVHPASAQFAIFPTSLPGGVAGEFYSEGVSITNAGETTWTWAITAGSLPPGVGLTPEASSANISGTPTAVGSYSFTLQATENIVTAAPTVLSQGYTIQIVPQLVVTTSSLAAATVGIAYSQQLQATGGVPPYNWVLGAFHADISPRHASRSALGRVRPLAVAAGGSLPPGLTLSASGLIAGTPTTVGTYTFSVTVNDSSMSEQFASATLSITVNPPAPVIITTTSPLPGGTVGKAYSIPLRAQGGAVPYTWTLASGTIPPGLTLGAAGSLTGTPTQAGNFTFALTVTDVDGTAATATFSLVVASGFAITTQSLAQATAGVAYSAQIVVTATTAPYTFSVTSGTLPPGLSLSATSQNPAGALSGTPQLTDAGITYTFTVTATDGANDTASQSYNLVIGPPALTISPATLPAGTVGNSYSETLTAAGGLGPYTYSISSGSLPGGLSLSSSGQLSGTPTAAGAFSFEVTAIDTGYSKITVSVLQGYQLTINPALPTPTITGVGSTSSSAQQPTISVQLAGPYPTNLTGTVILTFAPAAGNVDDPEIQFATGGRKVIFTIPAGQTAAVFPATPSFDTGTIAGTITLTLDLKADGLDVTPQPAPTEVITIAPAVPVISNVTVSTTSGGIEVDVTGFSNTREMVSATFTFQAASGTTLQGGTQTITAGPLFAAWYSNSSSDQYGSQFTFAQPFTINGTGVASVSVTLTNTQGTSTATSASVP